MIFELYTLIQHIYYHKNLVIRKEYTIAGFIYSKKKKKKRKLKEK